MATDMHKNCGTDGGTFRVSFQVLPKNRAQSLKPATAELLACYVSGGGGKRIKTVIEIDEKELTTDQQITLITGPSGTGKTTLLKELVRRYGQTVARPERLISNTTRPIIEQLRLPADEAVPVLVAWGLSDPFTWARHPGELSEGQLVRFRLAKAESAGARGVVADEFLNGLDALTAKAVAWSAQKRAREIGLQIIAATCRDDLVKDLQPDVIYTTQTSADVDVTRREPVPGRCTVADGVVIEPGSKDDYDKLAHLHYIGKEPATWADVIRARDKFSGEILGVAVLSYPPLKCWPRKQVNQANWGGLSQRKEAERVNKEVRRISRLIVREDVRGIGIASMLVKRLEETAPVYWLEVSTRQAHYSRLFDRLGWRRIEDPKAGLERKLKDLGKKLMVPAIAQTSGDLLKEWSDTLSVRKRRRFRRLVWLLYHEQVIHQRVKSPRPKHVPAPGNPHWPRAWEYAAFRLTRSPVYLIKSLTNWRKGR